MRLFETDAFEERIRSVENRAGRIAYRVLYLLVMLIAIYNMKVTGDRNNLMSILLLAAIGVSIVVHFVVTKRNGLSEAILREEDYRIGQSPDGPRFMRNRMLTTGIVVSMLLYMMYDFNLPVEGNIVAFVAAAIMITSTYFIDRNRFTKKPPEKKVRLTKQDPEA